MPRRHATEGSKCPGMGVEQHLVGLAEVGCEHEGPTGRQLRVAASGACAGRPRTGTSATQSNWKASPISKLMGTKAMRVGVSDCACCQRLANSADRASAAWVAHGILQCPEHGLDATTLAFVAMAVGLQPGGQLFCRDQERWGWSPAWGNGAQPSHRPRATWRLCCERCPACGWLRARLRWSRWTMRRNLFNVLTLITPVPRCCKSSRVGG